MSEWKKKRFWSETGVTEFEEGYGVHLDGRYIKTPAKASLIVPTRALADAIADEWAAQGEVIDPNAMPVTRSANAAIDKVATQFDEVVTMIAEYGGTDLLCYRAEAPEALIKRQAEAWDPLLDWARETFDAPLVTTKGVMFIAQPEESLRRLHDEVGSFDPFQLAAFHDLVGISGSLVLAFAVTRDRLSADAAWQASRIDEDWQEEQWGPDEEATSGAERKQRAFKDAARIFSLTNRL